MAHEPSLLQDRLSVIVTRWTLLKEANGSSETTAHMAQERLLKRYGTAIRRYLLGCVRNADQADELYQEFAIKFLQGGLHGAKPEKGKFRYYLKGVLFHLLADHQQKLKKQPLGFNSATPEPAGKTVTEHDGDEEFHEQWRAQLLADAWSRLQEEEKNQGQPWHTVLTYRRDHPDERSETMAGKLSQLLGKPMTAAGVRQALHRARERFADILLENVMQSLSEPSVETLHEELADLKLLQYCEVALERFEQGTAAE